MSALAGRLAALAAVAAIVIAGAWSSAGPSTAAVRRAVDHAASPPTA